MIFSNYIKLRLPHIYTKGEDQTDTYIYYQIEQQASTKTKGEDQTDIYIYYKIEQQNYTKTKGEDQTDTYIY
jgi:hypothetical protein